MTRAKAPLAACLVLAANAAFPQFSMQSAMSQTVNGNAAARVVDAGPAYADMADLATRAPLILVGEITQVIALKPDQAGAVTAGYRRAYVTLRTVALIRGEGGVAPNLSYIYDIQLDSRGKLPKLKKQRMLLFARPGTRPGEIQLVAPDAQIGWSQPRESMARAIVGELLAARTPPVITGLGDAFHVAGTVEGEGETQIFLKTDSGEPVSLSIVRRPGQTPQWAVALGEIVDEAAAAPKRDSLLWYRLACFLPPALPAAAVRTLAVADAEAARADYRVVLEGLGPCGRTRGVR